MRWSTPRVLVVPVRAGRAVRLDVERLMRERGWESAASPADADLLVVCGTPDADTGAAVDRVWNLLGSPRARADIPVRHGVAERLDRARAELGDRPGRPSGRTSGRRRPAPGDRPDDSDDDTRTDHDGDVAGLPMAERAPDRDGLTLDRLHLTLGPVLPDWPAGLVVRLAVQGDVVQTAAVEVWGEPGGRWDGPPAAAALDSLARLLSVCGAATATRRARRLRDEVLAGSADPAALNRFARRLRRSWTLRWATDGVGRLDGRHGDLTGDATQRCRRWLDVVAGSPPVPGEDRTAAVLTALPGLLEGQELATVRVVVASLDPDLESSGTGATS
ncbi:hypothetical protein [Pseudonocardia hydrocarbonoxydans]